jgi:tetratricopeptide (TPR) repeat protein
MRTARLHPLFAFCAALLLVFATPERARAVDSDTIERLIELVEGWQVVEARAELEPLLKSDPDDPGLAYVLGRVLFYEGRYDEAVKVMDAALARVGRGDAPAFQRSRDEIARNAKALAGFDEYTTPDGRFLIRTQGKDKLLIPWLLEVLQAQDDALAKDFEYRTTGQVLVEIYPDIKYLSMVSPLTEKDIETSGTIALCKYNKLMFTSPRGLVRGYGWRDTVSHEFVHYYVTKKSADTVPIWLHEGIAKFQETRWRNPPAVPLDPPQEDLLARSLSADKLVTFQQMHPSMAKLPSQEAAALAFAEVHMVIDYLWKKKGFTALNALLERLKSGAKMDDALKRTYGVDLDGLWTQWKKEMLTRGFKTHPGLVQTSLKFKRPGQEGSSEEDLKASDHGIDTIKNKKAKDFAHLGELLRAKSRHAAAVKEYHKATAVGGDGNPLVQNGAASSLLALGRPAEVPSLLQRVKSYYPTYLSTFMNLGEAALKLGRGPDAIAAFEEALGINPFHPRVHEALVQLYTAAGNAPAAERSKAALVILQMSSTTAR